MSNDRLSLSRSYKSESVNINTQEAAALQTFPPDFEFVGTKGEAGLMVGNAVPPLIATALLSHLWKETT